MLRIFSSFARRSVVRSIPRVFSPRIFKFSSQFRSFSSSPSSSSNAPEILENNIAPTPNSVARIHVSFTCGPCSHRNLKSMNPQAYRHGVVLIRCDGCKKLHLFADHLGWFGDERMTIEDIMKEKGMKVQIINSWKFSEESKQISSTNSIETNISMKENKNSVTNELNENNTKIHLKQEFTEFEGTLEFNPEEGKNIQNNNQEEIQSNNKKDENSKNS